MIGPLSYIGGKKRLAKIIVSLIPPHLTYCEPFCGGAQVFFHKPPSRIEILNDLDAEVVNFFRVCQQHHEELIRYSKFTVAGRATFDTLLKLTPEVMTDVQRAARFVFLQKNSYAGKVTNQYFKLNVVKPPTYNVERLPEIIESTYKRLQKVQLECRPYGKVIRSCDRETTFFYLDPPYWGKPLYKFNLLREDFVALRDTLAGIKGKFLLSLNDVPDVRELFSSFQLKEISVSYSSQPTSGKRYPELLISNYSVPS